MANLETQTRTTIAAYFSTHDAAEKAVSELKLSGFNASQIGYAGRVAGDSSAASSASGLGSSAGQSGTTGSGSFGTGSTGTGLTGAGSTSGIGTHQPGTAGHGHEGTWQKIKNFFEGGDVEPYADERTRGDFASHEITSASTPPPAGASGGYMNTGDNTDGYDPTDLHGSFSDLSIPDQHSRYFGHRIGQGEEGAVVTVNAAGREAEAEEILRRNGGDLGADAGNYDYSGGTGGALSGAGTQRIQLLGEVLRVHKDRISRGEVRIRKEVITEQQTVQVPVTREELVLERVPVEGSTPAAGTIGENSEIRIPLTEERAGVEKQTVVREEVAVGKRAIENVENVNSSVEHEELRVEDETANRR